MKQLKFKEEFKDSILKKDKVATIRNSLKVNVGEFFEIVIDGKIVAKAECIFSFKETKTEIIEALNLCLIFKRDYLQLHDYFVFKIHLPKLGLNGICEALDFYKKYLKNEHCYLYIFKLVEGE